jgi:RNA polymerase sigma-70 factor (ECF subfamily)
MSASDEQLMDGVRRGDEAAFAALMARYDDPLRRHLASVVRDAAAAEDLTQEVFLRLWTRAEQWECRGAFRAWLFRIATNLALNHLRSVRRRREEPLAQPAGDLDTEGEATLPDRLVDALAPDPAAALEAHEQMARIRDLLELLPLEKREVVRLVHEEDLEIREVAERLSIPEGTVKSRLYHARRHLARAWDEMEREDA